MIVRLGELRYIIYRMIIMSFNLHSRFIAAFLCMVTIAHLHEYAVSESMHAVIATSPHYEWRELSVMS